MGLKISLASLAALFSFTSATTAWAQLDDEVDDGEMVFEDPAESGQAPPPEPPEDNKPPSSKLERAIKQYEKKDYYFASIELAKVIAGETGDSAFNKQRAEFFMGKTLYQMGFYAAALTYFDRIVALRTGHRFYDVTLKWLAALSRVLPETSGILEKIGSYDASKLDDPVLAEVRDELHYLIGRNFYRRGREGDFDKAITLFQRVNPSSPFYVKAKFFEGVTYVRKYEGRPAITAFKEILVQAKENPEAEDIAEFEELARLQMARIFYSTQQYKLSIKYYEELPQNSPDWLNSLFEASWAYFMLVNNSKALGNIHTLNAPYFEEQFFPESVLLKAVIYWKYCLYDQALESVAEFNNAFRPLRKDLDAILGKYQDNNEFYQYIKKITEGKGGLPEQTQRLVTSVLNDRTLRKTFAWVEELEKELAMLQKADKAWLTTRIATEVEQELSISLGEAETDAGRLARQRIQRLTDELRKLTNDGRKIQFETLSAKEGQISAEARGERIKGQNKPEPIEVDDEHFVWDFSGEYWKDELGFYRFRIRSKCPK